jgi:hypothetical protein
VIGPPGPFRISRRGSRRPSAARTGHLTTPSPPPLRPGRPPLLSLSPSSPALVTVYSSYRCAPSYPLCPAESRWSDDPIYPAVRSPATNRRHPPRVRRYPSTFQLPDSSRLEPPHSFDRRWMPLANELRQLPQCDLKWAVATLPPSLAPASPASPLVPQPRFLQVPLPPFSLRARRI